jgi:L-lactate dehydrogenase complex protein LldG
MSRDVVLARIRAALAGATPLALDVPRDYRPGGEPAPGDPALVELLVDRLVDYRATVHRGEVAAAVASILPAGATVVVPAGLPRSWLPDGISVLTDDGLSPAALDAVDGVVTAATVAVAETGTIVLDGSADQGRRVISLLPDLHVCVVRTDQVVAGVPEALRRLTPGRPLTWISGPSATSDIELNRVEGVHGPRNLHVVLVPAAGPHPS